MCVHSNVFRQRHAGKERLLIHLYNDVNTTAFHALPGDDVPLREEVLPIHDIRLELTGYKVKSIHQQPEGKELPVIAAKDGVKVVVSKLEVHSILVLELE